MTSNPASSNKAFQPAFVNKVIETVWFMNVNGIPVAHRPSESYISGVASQSSAPKTPMSRYPSGRSHWNHFRAIRLISWRLSSNSDSIAITPFRGSAGVKCSIFTFVKDPVGTCLLLSSTIVCERSTSVTTRPLAAIISATGLPVPHPQSRTRASPGSSWRNFWTILWSPASWPNASSYCIPTLL